MKVDKFKPVHRGERGLIYDQSRVHACVYPTATKKTSGSNQRLRDKSKNEFKLTCVLEFVFVDDTNRLKTDTIMTEINPN